MHFRPCKTLFAPRAYWPTFGQPGFTRWVGLSGDCVKAESSYEHFPNADMLVPRDQIDAISVHPANPVTAQGGSIPLCQTTFNFQPPPKSQLLTSQLYTIVLDNFPFTYSRSTISSLALHEASHNAHYVCAHSAYHPHLC